MKEKLPELRHGFSPRSPVGLRSELAQGNFGWLYRGLEPWTPFIKDIQKPEEELDLLAASMAALSASAKKKSIENPCPQQPPEHLTLAAGYTYLAQFIDHDLTFDPSSLSQQIDDPELLNTYRSPSFDLDSVYGRGPRAEPFLYSERKKYLFDISRNASFEMDLPRIQNRAVVADPRNDDFVIISQLHVRFLNFHNQVAIKLQNEGAGILSRPFFDEIRRIVRWHYQWIVIYDFLRAILEPSVYSRLLAVVKNRKTSQESNLLHFRPKNAPYLPVEFSAAAFRFGHSLPRPEYFLNQSLKDDRGGKAIPTFDKNNPVEDGVIMDLRGNRRLPEGWGIDWRFFFHGEGSDVPPPQSAMCIDTNMSDPLANLTIQAQSRSLATMDLKKGLQYGLPSGQTLARRMGLEENEILKGSDAFSADIDKDFRKHLQQSTPLWYYILREAELGGAQKLGRLGSEIVGEVIVGLMLMDPASFLTQHPRWEPTLGRVRGEFDMYDLLTYQAP